MRITITWDDALEIAEQAYEDDNYDIECFTGYYIIAEDNDDNVAIAINKDEDGYYCIYVCSLEDYSEWEHTDTLSIYELADKIMEIAYAWSNKDDDCEEEHYPNDYDFYGIKRPEERDEWDDLWADRARDVGATLF